jgi:Protein of unknown function (DUF1488)
MTNRAMAEAQVMPLTRARDNYLPGPDGVRFLMQDGPLEVPCRISHETLSDFGGTVGLNEVAEIFLLYRDRIDRAASAKYDRSSRREHDVVTVTLDDLKRKIDRSVSP